MLLSCIKRSLIDMHAWLCAVQVLHWDSIWLWDTGHKQSQPVIHQWCQCGRTASPALDQPGEDWWLSVEQSRSQSCWPEAIRQDGNVVGIPWATRTSAAGLTVSYLPKLSLGLISKINKWLVITMPLLQSGMDHLLTQDFLQLLMLSNTDCKLNVFT